MITLTRLSGSVFVLNSDLIERIDSTPDSVVTLIDGKKYVVTESLQEIVDRVRAYRGEVVAFGSQLAERGEAHDPSRHPREQPREHARERVDDRAAAGGGHATTAHDRPTIVPLVRPHGEG